MIGTLATIRVALLAGAAALAPAAACVAAASGRIRPQATGTVAGAELADVAAPLSDDPDLGQGADAERQSLA